jgi:hypothetical protein
LLLFVAPHEFGRIKRNGDAIVARSLINPLLKFTEPSKLRTSLAVAGCLAFKSARTRSFVGAIPEPENITPKNLTRFL